MSFIEAVFCLVDNRIAVGEAFKTEPGHKTDGQTAFPIGVAPFLPLDNLTVHQVFGGRKSDH